ncbi:MAG: hypothetical protein J5838_07705 [Desulfovibrio sp.]|nr:hypothetical protein [Desulfovibrio sp.]
MRLSKVNLFFSSGRGLLCAALLIVLLAASGCTARRSVQMEWMPVETNRNAGFLSYAVMWNPRHDRPSFDEARAADMATEKCLAWGFQYAEPAGSATECTRFSTDALSTCIRKERRLDFRCVNAVVAERR